MATERKPARSRELSEWFGNPKGDFFAGIVSAFAVIPGVVGFTIVAGVDPVLGLYTSVAFLLLLSFIGGRPAMVSAGAGSMAVLVASLVASHGLDYMFAAVLIAGIIQLALGLVGIGALLKRIPRSIIVGFVDGLAFIILLSQITTFNNNLGDTDTAVAAMVCLIVLGLAVIFLFPKVSKVIPSTLVAIAVVTIASILLVYFAGDSCRTAAISDLGSISSGWPGFNLPSVLTDAGALSVIMPYAVSLAFVGLLETSLTMQVVDNITQTPSNPKRECCAQGVGNMVCGGMGAMPGCAMIGQAVACVKSGGRGRLSTLVAALILALLLAFGSDVLGIIPLAALIAVMLFVCYSTFDWDNLREMVRGRDRNSLCATAMTIITLATVIVTHNLAYGAVAGLLLALLFWLAFGKDRTFEIR
jgi:SulP family sulfate permease